MTNTILNPKINKLFDECEKIPNCSNSDGITAECLLCNKGFMMMVVLMMLRMSCSCMCMQNGFVTHSSLFDFCDEHKCFIKIIFLQF